MPRANSLPGSYQNRTLQRCLCGVLLSLAVLTAPVLAPATEQLPSANTTAASSQAFQRTSYGVNCYGSRARQSIALSPAEPEKQELPGYGEAYGSTSRDWADPVSLGTSQQFQLPAVKVATLFTEPMYRVEVPDDTVSLTIDLEPASPAAGDIDLYVSRTVMPTVSNGIVVSDFAALGPTSSERIVIDRSTSPALEPGTYYIALGMVTRAVAVTGALRISIETENEGRINLAEQALPGRTLPGPLSSSWF
jgi:hypothetical protein